MLRQEIQQFLQEDSLSRFLRYVTVDTRSDEQSTERPSTPGQIELARMVEAELKDLGLQNLELTSDGFLYAVLPASEGTNSPPLTFLAHFDTSPSESGRGVCPIVRENYDGGPIRFPRNPDLILSPEEEPDLLLFKGETIITAAGDTLLGADDKAGIAEIMAALAALVRFPEISHPELRIAFTPDEEIGRGTDGIDLSRLGRYGYTMDGGMIGELEDECFNAHKAVLVFKGRNIHPGYAKNQMINAAAVAARFIASLPEAETPEHTEKREGFFHMTEFKGDENEAKVTLIIRDFEAEQNARRIEFLRRQIAAFELRYPGLQVTPTFTEQYRNMNEVLSQHPEVVKKAEQAMAAAGISVIRKAIRGGTDGARLCFMGLPTPNIFAGGLRFHSKTEWIPARALQKASETILHLCRLWAGK
ncbi:MAG TPA: peptidase T [Acidobacteriota bacterium]|nr:peptidase T [Acidobacteriota bacterium]